MLSVARRKARRFLDRYPTLQHAIRLYLKWFREKTGALPTSASSRPIPLTSAGGLEAATLPRQARRYLLVPFRYPLPQTRTTGLRIAVMMHVFYTDQLTALLDCIANIPGSPDLFITTDSSAKREYILQATAGRANGKVEICLVPNRGRDIAGKFYALGSAHRGHDLVVHLHTKRSPHAGADKDWFKYLTKTLVGSKDIVQSIIAAFEAQPRLGILFAEHWKDVRTWINWGFNFPKAKQLGAAMGFSLARDEPLEFPSGSMFWARPAALAPLIDLDLKPEDFQEEAGQLDGTTAHTIERLVLRACEHSRHSWIKVALRGEALPENAVDVTSKDLLRDLLKFHPVLLADPAMRASQRAVPDRPETRPIRFAADFSDRPRATLFLPTIEGSSVFGGIATALALFDSIAQQLGDGVDKRMVLTTFDGDIDPSDIPEGWHIAEDRVPPYDRGIVALPPYARFENALPIRSSEVLFASAWWDAEAAFRLLELQRAFFGRSNRLRYFIQDYEPGFVGWSSSWVKAEQTYHKPQDTVALINSPSLSAYFDQIGLSFPQQHVFKPLWNRGLGLPSDLPSAERENILLVYWRPHVRRNLSTIVASALAEWLESDPHGTRDWSIYAIGQDTPDVQITSWRWMKCLGKLPLNEYARLMRRAKVGLAFALSPHPSYAPLEMAAFGMRVVTNSFGRKDLSVLGNRIESLVELSSGSVASALRRAADACGSPQPAGSFDFNAAFSTESDLSVIVRAVSDGILKENVELER
ncbi:MAG: rhamnan synthesis F family protein [Xanthobacteraceae bacterium]